MKHLSISIRDVAKHSGVSIGTVSRAFNGYEDIRTETRDRIFASAEILGYIPNVSARNLSSKRPPNVALVISGLLEGNPKDNMVYLMLQGIFSYALSNGLEVAVYATDSAEQRCKSYAQFCKEHSISGAILSGVTTDDAYFIELLDSSIPCVAIDVPLQSDSHGWVSIDNVFAAEEITNHLFQSGHENIVIVSGKENAAVNMERMSGISKAYTHAGYKLSPAKVLFANFNEDQAYNHVKKYLENTPKKDLCTAFLCLSDIMALGVIAAIKDTGFRVPEDFSVTGFDGLSITEYTSPAVSTVVQDIRNIGLEAICMLHKIMQGEKGTHKIVPHRLALRNSIQMLS